MSMFVGDKTKQTRPLNVNAAIDLGAELASEGFLLAIALALLVLEYNRGAKNDKIKADQLKNRFQKLESELEAQRTEIDTLKKLLVLAKEPPPTPSQKENPTANTYSDSTSPVPPPATNAA